MDTVEFLTVPVIVSVVYTLLTLFKHAVADIKKVEKFIPIIAAGLGAALGLLAFLSAPEMMPAGNAFVALMLGGSSGLAATGTHQIFKQINKKDGKSDGNDGTDSKSESEPS